MRAETGKRGDECIDEQKGCRRYDAGGDERDERETAANNVTKCGLRATHSARWTPARRQSASGRQRQRLLSLSLPTVWRWQPLERSGERASQPRLPLLTHSRSHSLSLSLSLSLTRTLGCVLLARLPARPPAHLCAGEWRPPPRLSAAVRNTQLAHSNLALALQPPPAAAAAADRPFFLFQRALGNLKCNFTAS